MSGGTFNYLDSTLKTEIFGFSDEFNNSLEDVEISHLVWDVFDLLHEYDLYKAGDTEKDAYKLAVRKFKTKWFNSLRTIRLREYIEDMMLKTRTECMSMIGIIGDVDCPIEKKLIDKYGDYVDKSVAASILGVTRATIYAMIDDHRLQTGYRGKRVSVASIAAYIKSKGGSYGDVDSL